MRIDHGPRRPGAVIVTGAGGAGCGRAIARRFARGGHAVLVTDIDEGGSAATVEAIRRDGGEASARRVDVRDAEQCKGAVDACVAHYGGVSVVINNASAPHPDDDGIAGWSRAIETDLLGALHMTRWAVEAMRHAGGGAIVNVASISALWHGRTTPGGFAGYDVAKAGLIRATTRLASLAAEGIRVNCVAPGWIGTPEVRAFWDALSPSERAARGMPAALIDVQQLAALVVRLARNEALAGRVVAWWSEHAPRLIAWGDRGYQAADDWPAETPD
jgi:3-oxoacyl-[acyl-carrier protein] reductase